MRPSTVRDMSWFAARHTRAASTLAMGMPTAASRCTWLFETPSACAIARMLIVMLSLQSGCPG
jgi:hypothetical protein